jgi:ubiquinone/menaquinone biosynthesis C-methylase UbiE
VLVSVSDLILPFCNNTTISFIYSGLMASESTQRLHFFEEIASYYDFLIDSFTVGLYARFLRKAIKVLAPSKGEKILDLCSGTGRAASWIAQSVGENGIAVGMDVAGSMVETAETRYRHLGNLTFLKQDVTEPWKNQNQFDGIFISFSLHELPQEDRRAVLEQSYLALKKEGRMVIADFNPRLSGWRKIPVKIFFKLFEGENLSFFSFRQEEVLRDVGFNAIEIIPVMSGLFQITLANKESVKVLH